MCFYCFCHSKYYKSITPPKIAKYRELLFNYNLTSLISRSKRMLQIICSRSFTSTGSREALV